MQSQERNQLDGYLRTVFTSACQSMVISQLMLFLWLVRLQICDQLPTVTHNDLLVVFCAHLLGLLSLPFMFHQEFRRHTAAKMSCHPLQRYIFVILWVLLAAMSAILCFHVFFRYVDTIYCDRLYAVDSSRRCPWMPYPMLEWMSRDRLCAYDAKHGQENVTVIMAGCLSNFFTCVLCMFCGYKMSVSALHALMIACNGINSEQYKIIGWIDRTIGQ